MTSLVQPYVDQENIIGTNSSRKGQTTTGSRQGGKIFQGCNEQRTVQKGGPRKALGILNTGNQNIERVTGKQDTFIKKQPSRDLSKKNKEQPKTEGASLKKTLKQRKEAVLPKCNQQVSISTLPVSVCKAASWWDDEPETMHIYQDPEDDFEDIFPSEERPSSYISQIKKWRPSMLFSLCGRKSGEIDPPSDLEDNGIIADIMSISEGVCLEEEEIVQLEYVPLPDIDSLYLNTSSP
ncbi:uncharacterized protein LOC106175436 [Lingula anatina]|uniref:Uncharacterized protein LOC106175436 n=1 Tax=Lingula anatina TaxID=7574 RepID=A0A1S3JSD2_LINAN|nr:uncharacterized protein LOC106175436 [Lingula anatina]XP_013412906.1 uncharacterized protein LOC106175436 [Lingula anatina]XP_013412914.1 uncharacterized protein LOC106175436 [Lingula anatina]XP_013412924.1 uncharacterized protein LOC106175436 [Lingula anatina]|eukprot:XP_013412898.1 uncharacterized protein LOC106175436 [Lingula anatina]